MTLPCTFRGIADWATHRQTAVLVYVLVLGCAVATVMGWFIWTCWLPVWEDAITSFPSGSRIEKEQLILSNVNGQALTENLFLSFEWIADLDDESASTSDIRIVFRTAEWRVGSLLGYTSLPYPSGYIIDLDPDKLQPWWLTRSYFFYLGGWIFIWASMLASWGGLAALYTVPVFLLAYFLGRPAGVRTVFRLNLLAMMPPAVFMTVGIVLYAYRHLNLQELLVAGAVHIPLAWIMIVFSVLHLNRKQPTYDYSKPTGMAPQNPFGSHKAEDGTTGDNPFGKGE